MAADKTKEVGVTKNTKTARYFGMTLTQFLIVLVLGVLVLCLVMVLILLFTGNNPSVQNQPLTQIQESSTLSAKIDLSISQTTDNMIVINGSTNLPNETIIMVTISGIASDYSAQDRVSVSNGKFTAGPFSSAGYGLDGGKYTVEALMPNPAIQPESVRKIIGNEGERLSGNQVVIDNGVLVVATKEFEVVAPTPSPLPVPTATATPNKIMLTGGDIGKGWTNTDHRVSLLNAYRIESLDGVKPFGERLGGYKGGYTQFLVVELQFERFTQGYDKYDLTDFWLYSYSNDGYLEYGADQYLYNSPRIVQVYYQEKIPVTIAFEVRPESHNFIMCYQFGVATDFSGKIVSECGSLGFQFKFND